MGLSAAAFRGLQFARRVARAGGHPWLHRGLRLVAAGSLIALGYCFGKGAFVIGAWLGVDLLTLSDLGTACACLGAIVITIGFTIPSWGPRLTVAAEAVTRARAYLQLYPLWQLLYRTLPDIALDPPRSRREDLLGLRDLDYRLYRRLIEIRDGRLALAPYMAPADVAVDELAARHRLPADAVREALQIRDAVHRLSAQEVTDRRPGAPVTTADGQHDDLAWLVQVSTALRRLPATTAAATPVRS